MRMRMRNDLDVAILEASLMIDTQIKLRRETTLHCSTYYLPR